MLIQSRIHAPASPKPKLQRQCRSVAEAEAAAAAAQRCRSRSRPARFGFARRCDGSSRRRCVAPFLARRRGGRTLRLRTPLRRQQPPTVRRPLPSSATRRASLRNPRLWACGIQGNSWWAPSARGVELTGHCQESIQVSRSLSLTLNSYLSRRLDHEYPVNVHEHRSSQPSNQVVEDDSLELQLQAKSRSCYSHNNYEEKQNSWIFVNMSLWSDLTFVAQIERLLSFCKRMSKLNVCRKA